MILLRITLSLITFAASVGAAYLAMWAGLSGGGFLSPANQSFAISVGVGLGVLLMILVNLLPYKNSRKTIIIAICVIGGLLLLFAFGFFLWVAAIASV